MLDSWRRHKNCSKCKSTIKQTKTRIEMLRKKRNAMQKYLKNDISDLVKSGLDVNAYDRTEGLQAELNLLSCYDFLDQYCEHIFSHLDTMMQSRECPEDCKEAVACLMYAAARLADLPELRQLRTLLFDRYGNSLECYVSKQFVEKLKPPLTKVMKLELMQDVAAEYGLEWNSKALQQKLSEQELERGQDNMNESGNNKESEAAVSDDENVRHTKSRRGKTKGSSEQVAQVENNELDHTRKHGGNGPSVRRASLPIELEQTSPEELLKRHSRANSCEPDIFGHVHPKLPNYDDVLARLTHVSVNPNE